ncbi:MAG TPA: hypothetical protein VK602_01310, partial [Phyllobacterium sp.]|nr:hypothetical protein [Phyllobacterium sp.]
NLWPYTAGRHRVDIHRGQFKRRLSATGYSEHGHRTSAEENVTSGNRGRLQFDRGCLFTLGQVGTRLQILAIVQTVWKCGLQTMNRIGAFLTMPR